MARAKKLTPRGLRALVLEEKRRMDRRRRKIAETSDPIADGIEDPAYANAEEVDADEFAGSLEKDIDYIKALKIHERKLRHQLKRVTEAKKRLRSRVIKKI
jgi:hypothetical protein